MTACNTTPSSDRPHEDIPAARLPPGGSTVTYLAGHRLALLRNFQSDKRASLRWAVPLAVATFWLLGALLAVAMTFGTGGSPAPFLGP